MYLSKIIEECKKGNIKKGQKFINQRLQIITYDGKFFVYSGELFDYDCWSEFDESDIDINSDYWD